MARTLDWSGEEVRGMMRFLRAKRVSAIEIDWKLIMVFGVGVTIRQFTRKFCRVLKMVGHP